MEQKTFARAGALLLCVGITCGAFGAHALREIVSPERLAVWDKAVLYQLIHGVALFAVGISATMTAQLKRSCILLLIGCLIFSGSLYLLVLTNTAWLGAITPIGGVLMIIGWCMITASCRS